MYYIEGAGCAQSWASRGRLAAHTLSVTQLAFSHDGSHLLSGSRDRSFAVFRRREGDVPPGAHQLQTIQCGQHWLLQPGS